MKMNTPESLYWKDFADEYLIVDREARTETWKPETPARVIRSYEMWLEDHGYLYLRTARSYMIYFEYNPVEKAPK